MEVTVRHGAIAAVVAGLLLIPSFGYTKDAGALELDPGRHQTGKADNWRILWVGGYRQQGVYQDVKGDRDHEAGRKEHAKDKQRDEEKCRRDREQVAKEKDAAYRVKVAAQEAARKARELKAKKCHGVGMPAGCTEQNPGGKSK